ncbi:MAG: hypothetical protein ABEJ84_06930 [Halodesulfurarchaeum sp.]
MTPMLNGNRRDITGMVEPGRTVEVHYTARMVDGPDAGEIVDTTDVDTTDSTDDRQRGRG